MTTKKHNGDDCKRHFKSLPIARLLQRSLAPAAKRRGFAETAIIGDWAAIVGKDLSDRCQPVKISRRKTSAHTGTLTISAMPALSLELQHASVQIIERVNQYFGYQAIDRLRFVHNHAHFKPAKGKRAENPLTSGQLKSIEAATSAIASEPLKQALQELGTAVMLKTREQSS